MWNHRKIHLLIICLACFCSLFGEADYVEIKDKANLPVLAPTFAAANREKIQLKNGLEAYLISDPNTDQSAAVLTVSAGSWDDPVEYPGLAHFLEHMLFLGTRKYPAESEYSRYIKEHGGSANAYTSNDYTAYLFSINNNAFSQALDRFSYFFKEPLFNPSGVSRELQAIDQEYAQNIENDDVREIYVLKALANPEHPYHRFNIGNSQTLAKVSRQTLEDWYRNHYSAHRMRLMVISPLPLEELKKMVVDDFSGVPNHETKIHRPSSPLFPKAALPRMIYVEPIKNIRRLTLVWDMPWNLSEVLETDPESLICNVLGHEGKESLLAELKREHLAESLSCGGNWLGHDNQVIYLNIELTDLGIQKLTMVIDRVFQALKGLREQGIPETLFHEVQQMDKVHYQYQQREDPFDTVYKYSMWLPKEDFSSFPLYSQVIQKYDPKAIQKLLDALTPQNCQFIVMAPSTVTKVKPDLKEPWLGVQYAVTPLSDERIKEWGEAQRHPAIELPASNPFIPNELSLVHNFPKEHTEEPLEEPTEAPAFPSPKLILDNSHAKIFFAPDYKFQQPELSWNFEIKTPSINSEKPESLVLADIFIKNALENLSDITYPAQMGGLNFSIGRGENGIAISIEGYSEKAPFLLDEILKKISYPLSEDNFKKYKELLVRDYQNNLKDSPLTQTMEFFKKIIYKNHVGPKAKLSALRRISLKKYNDFSEGLFKKNYVQGMLFGNILEQDAKKAAESFHEVLKQDAYAVEEQPKIEIITLPADKGPYYFEQTVAVQGNAVLLGIENPQFSFKNRAAQQILMQAISEPFFTNLRTKQQTGYIVTSFGEEIEKHLFDLFAVQSNTHDPRDLLSRFELFIEGYLQEIENELPEARFENIKNALILKLDSSAKNIKEMGDLLYKIAFKYNADFQWMEERKKGFNELSYNEFLNLSKEFLGRSNKRRVAVLTKGILPEGNAFFYSRLILPERLRAMSTFSSH